MTQAPMRFVVVDKNVKYQKVPWHCYLHVDYWDDWKKYRTQFGVSVVDNSGEEHHIGSVKIGQKGLQPGSSPAPGVRKPEVPGTFEALPESFFSVGQNETYYEALNLLGFSIRTAVLTSLRDCAFEVAIFERYLDQDVMSESLLRDVSETQVRTRFSRLAHGDAALTAFQFAYKFPEPEDARGAFPESPTLTFSVSPHSVPPTNVHVLIGRNGVGKTRCMQFLTSAILQSGEPEKVGRIDNIGFNSDDWAFAGLVSVCFSAFDDFQLPPPANAAIRYSQVGLHNSDAADGNSQSLTQRLTKAFRTSFEQIRQRPRRDRWLTAVAALAADPLFSEANVAALLDIPPEDSNDEIERFFKRLSSGHKIVLLTITKLVELVDEATVVLLDEPEVHLHPPLLSAFVRALANLLLQRNGVAIIATHSPVVLQEVPASCVWILQRSGANSAAERPPRETFGENVGALTRDVFGLEVTDSGFYMLLRTAVDQASTDFDELVAQFNGQLGGEARAILRALLSERDNDI